METTIGARLQVFIHYKKMSNVEFAATLGTAKQKFDYWVKTNGITTEWFAKLINTYRDLNPHWLLLGTGNMINEPEKQATLVNEPGAGYAGSNENLQHRIKLLEALLYDELGKKQKGE